MSISKGAFGQSSKGGFIESPLGVRGWRGGLVVLSESGVNNAEFASLNPDTGEQVWAVNETVVTSNAPTFIAFNSSLQLFTVRSGTVANGGGIYLRDMNDGSVAGRTENAQVVNVAAIGRDLVWSGNSATIGNFQARTTNAMDETFVWQYDAPNANQTARCTTDSAGNSYFDRNNSTTVNLLPGIQRWALDKNGALLWEQLQTTPFAPDGFGYTSTGIGDCDGEYIYMIYNVLEDAPFPPDQYQAVLRISKSTGDIIDSMANAYSFLVVNGSNRFRCPRLANGALYVPTIRDAATASPRSVVKLSTDLTELALLDLGVTAYSVDKLPGGDVLVVGNTTTTWPGSGGARANCWRISSDLSTIRWGVQVGPSTYNGVMGISSLRY